MRISRDEIKKKIKRAKDAQYQKDRREWYRQKGICYVCGRNYVETGRAFCKTCADRSKTLRLKNDPNLDTLRQRNKERRLYRVENHLCIDCGKPVTKYQKCDRCRENHRFSQYKWRHNKKMEQKGMDR